MKIFNLPDLGEGLAEAEIREWYVKEGDHVNVDQPLVSMETAKAVVDVPSPYAGKILKLHGNANQIIKTGAPLITYELDEEVSDKPKGSVVGALEESSNKWEEGDVIIGAAKTQSTAIKAMPAARVLAKELNVDLNAVKPSGPQGLITTEDVKQHLQQSSPRLNGAESLHGVRRTMATVMTQSHREVVAVTIIEDAIISHLPLKYDLTALLIEAMVVAAKKEPALNAWFDGKHMERKLFSEINIGLAVDTNEGLFVPVIKDAEKLSKEALRAKINDYKTTVANRTIAPSDMHGATITLSNFGTIAGKYATPIIVPPTVAILGCGRSRQAVVPLDNQMSLGRIMPLSLTFDHRAVTGGEATRFLAAVIEHINAQRI